MQPVSPCLLLDIVCRLMEKLVTSVRCPKETMTTKECLWWRETKHEASSSLPRRTVLSQRVAVVTDSNFLMVETAVMVNNNNNKDLAISHSRTINSVTANRTGKQHNKTMDFNIPSLLREASGNGGPRDTEWRNSLSKFPPTLPQLSQS